MRQERVTPVDVPAPPEGIIGVTVNDAPIGYIGFSRLLDAALDPFFTVQLQPDTGLGCQLEQAWHQETVSTSSQDQVRVPFIQCLVDRSKGLERILE